MSCVYFRVGRRETRRDIEEAIDFDFPVGNRPFRPGIIFDRQALKSVRQALKINYCPKGLLRRDPSNFRVRLSVVCLSVRLSVCHTQFRSGNPPKPLGGVSVRVQKQVRLGHLTDYRRNPKYRRKTCK